jgi:hypothetical protein
MVGSSGTGVIGRFPVRLVLALACVATCVIPGDAVARAGSGGAPVVYRQPPSASGRTSAAAQTRLLLSDMSEPSQEAPAGVPSWFDWAEHPRVHPISSLMRTFRAFTAWGQLYQCSGTLPTRRAAVELRDLQTWVLLRGSSRWQRIQFSSDLGGAAFAEDYHGPTVAGRYSVSPSGTSAQLVSGHNFHFWPSAGRVSLNPSHVAAITVALEARLQPSPKSAGRPCLVLSVGGDLWRSLIAAPGGSSPADVGIGRFKRVESHWRLFTMATASAGILHQDPLPLISPAADDF